MSGQDLEVDAVVRGYLFPLPPPTKGLQVAQLHVSENLANHSYN